MSFELAFVDSIASSPVTRVNLHDTSIKTVAEGTDWGMPELDRAYADTLLADGAIVPSAAYGNRMLTLHLQLMSSNLDTNATNLQTVLRELDRPSNILRFKLGTTAPVFFRTLRSAATAVTWVAPEQEVIIQVMAEPFACGLRVDGSVFTIYNDPAEGTTANANPFFETNASDWTGQGGSVVRSTAQFHEGVASLLFTPDGVTATSIARSTAATPTTVGTVWRVSGWMRCATSRNVALQTRWYDGADAILSSNSVTISVTANTWTYFDGTFTAPASTAGVRIAGVMTGTPPASDLLYMDEMRLRQPTTNGGMCMDVTGVTGDVETPPLIRINNTTPWNAGTMSSAIGVRRTGDPTTMPMVLQAESMTLGNDTTLPGNDPLFSGPGSNYARCTFATFAAGVRLTTTGFPAVATKEARGRYRVWLRCRKNTSTDVITARFSFGPPGLSNGTVTNDSVTLPANTTNMCWVDLGDLTMPVYADPVEDGLSGVEMPVVGLTMTVSLTRDSGSGSVDMDALVLVPAPDDGRYCFITWSAVAASAPTYLVMDTIHDMIFPMDAGPLMHSNNQGFPRSGKLPMLSPNQTNRIVWVINATPPGSVNQTDLLTHTATVLVSYWPRYVNVARPVAT